MQNEDFFFLGKISSLNSLKKSGSEKKKNSLRCFSLRRYGVY